MKNTRDFQDETYLISSALWEKVTGEKVAPRNMMTVLFSKPGTIVSSKSLEIIKTAQDRTGSMELQHLLEESNDKEREFIIESLIPSAAELAVHPTANFVIQKLCDKASQSELIKLSRVIYENLGNLLHSQTGCRVVQRFLEVSPPNLIAPCFELIKASFITLSTSTYGNYIIHRIIEALPQRAPEIVEAVTPNLSKLISNHLGCRIVQGIFNQYDVDVLRPLIDEIIINAKELSVSQFGNYIVQTVLDKGSEEDNVKIVDNILDQFYEFSMHKLASNVTEKCIKTASQKDREKIFDVVIGKEGKFNYSRIAQLATDQYGNYVIQRVIDFGTKEQLGAIYQTIKMDHDNFSSTIYGRHVIGKLEEHGYKFH